MTTKIGINGFGRIGRLAFKAINEHHKGRLEVVAINDLTDSATNAHLFKYDSNYGVYQGKVESTKDSIIIDGKSTAVVAEKDPAKIPWAKYGAEIVIESTGFFTDANQAAAHLQGGAKRVIISAPSKGDAAILVMGVNHTTYDPAKHKVVSNASCTTNGIAPLIKVLHGKFGIVRGLMTTVHSYTNDQRILDTVHKDLRRARAAAINIIPTTTGAASMMGIVIPELKGKLHGLSLRVPTPTVSVIDFVADLKRAVTEEEVNKALKDAAEGELKHILQYCDEPLVSSDFKGNPHSSIIDAQSTMVVDGTMVKVIAWYDNEWGYSCRLGDLASYMAGRGL
ncbi:MAG: type I glyceraldehyde-3-phosphate dehydrogenase [Dehalococcoidia bacterium]|nr:type I glyceraldehyde-3-phosphate dehydrogenase [Dehalococcoidia bacterium]